MIETPSAATRPLIVTKIRPPRRRRGLVRRQRLVDLLSQHVDRKLILVSAPAGYGKTCLMLDYLQESAFPVCWFRVDELDADPALFFEYLVASLRQQFPETCEATLAMLHSQGAWDIDALVASLVNEISEHIGEFFLLVLDDYQKLDDAARVNAAVDALLQYLPDNCQVILLTRTLPKKLTLTRLAAEGHVVGIGQTLLRFSPEEIGELLRAESAAELTAEDCQRLHESTEGWVTALALAGPSLLRKGRAARPVLGGEALFSYLASEVLAEQPDDVVDFMLATSILENLSPSLCDALLERSDSRERLRQLVDRNAFIWEIEGEGEWYRYHQLMQEYLRRELGRRGCFDLPALHRRAGDWFAAVGDVESEIHHRLASGDLETAAARMEGVGADFLAGGRYRTIVDWVDSLPESERHARPWLIYYYAAALGFLSKFDEALEQYDELLSLPQAARDVPLRATALIGRAYGLRLLGRLHEAAADCRAALQMVGDSGSRLAGEAHRSLGLCYLVLGDMPAAAGELGRALEAFEALGLASEAAATHTDLSAYYHGAGQIEKAISHAEAARRHWLAVGNPAALARALNNLGTAYHAMGRFEEARSCLTEALAQARRAGVSPLQAASILSLAELDSDQGAFSTALALYSSGIEVSRSSAETWLLAYGLAMGADALRLAGRVGEAAAWLAQARSAIAGLNAAYEDALVDHCQAALELDQGNPAAAEAGLSRAAAVFERLGQRRELVRSLLYLIAARLRLGDRAGAATAAERARQVMAGFPLAAIAPHLRRLPEVVALVAGGGVALELEAPGAGAPAQRSPRRRPAALPVASRPGRLVVRALGPLDVRLGSSRLRAADWQTATTRDLFVYLLEHPGGGRREELMALLWPESSYVRARSALHSTLHRLRRAIGREMIEMADDRYRLAHRDRIRYDVAIFLALLGKVRSVADSDQTIAQLSRALALVRGPFLEGMDAEWIHARRAELTQLAIEAALRLGAGWERRGEPKAALAAYRRAVDWEPWLEEAHRGIMRCYARSGARSLALRHFDELRRTLEEELGIAPEPDTQALYESIRGGQALASA